MISSGQYNLLGLGTAWSARVRMRGPLEMTALRKLHSISGHPVGDA
jgi:hypothetical protein